MAEKSTLRGIWRRLFDSRGQRTAILVPTPEWISPVPDKELDRKGTI